MPQIIVAHPYIFWVAVTYVSITAVGCMPTPTAKSSGFYEFCFKFLHTLTAQAPRVIATFAPGSAIGQKIIGAANVAAQQACNDAEKETK